MSESNSIRPFAIHEASNVHRRSYSVVSTQNSFEEELLKLQFFDTQVEASPIFPIEPTTKNEKNREPEPESETDDSQETTEAEDRSREYAYGIVTSQTPIATDTPVKSPSERDGDVNVEQEVDTEKVDPKSSTEITKSISRDQLSLQNSVDENSEPALMDLEGAGHGHPISNGIPHDSANEYGDPNPKDASNTTLVDPQPQKSESRGKEPIAVGSKNEIETGLALKNEEENNHEDSVFHANNQDSRPLAEAAAFQSTDNETLESKPQESRRAERLERNRFDSDTTFNDNLRDPTVEAGLDNQPSIEATIEPLDRSSIPTEQTTISNIESVSDSVVLSAPQSTLTPNPLSLSIAAGIVPNATLNSNPSTPPSSGAVSVTNNISGSTSTAASRETTGSSRANLTPYQESKLVQRVLRGIEQLGNGGGQVRIRLHPPELGTLQMTLKFEATQVTAQFEVESRVARDALLGNSQVLKDRLKEQGLEVQKFEVEVRSDVNDSLNSSTGDRQEQRNSSNDRRFESRFAVSNNNRLNPDSRPEPSNTTMPWIRTKGSLDVSA
ncbi:MAG: flagellar hook-length control protein FliK [Pirellula sp.]